MYTTKRINHRIVEGNAYTTIGDPYNVAKEKLPSRWKGKRLNVQQKPINADNGNFSKLEYKGYPFQEMERYSKTQPNRKMGFGTKDAFRSGEFAATIRTEQYRTLLRKEQSIMEKFCNPARDKEMMEKAQEEKKARTFCEGLVETSHLYDVGRTQVTKFDPKHSRDRFYTPNINHEKRMGGLRTMSQDIGQEAWSYKYTSPEYGPVHTTKQFWDKSHLVVQGV